MKLEEVLPIGKKAKTRQTFDYGEGCMCGTQTNMGGALIEPHQQQVAVIFLELTF